MTRSSGLPVLAALFLTLVTVACGSSTPWQMQSITVNPAMADSQSAPNGQVQFTATGNFNKPPLAETPIAVAWAVSDGTIATINNSGVGQCIGGAVGTATITGSLTVEPLDGQGASKFLGTAQLTCP
jgi:hypothetical protein